MFSVIPHDDHGPGDKLRNDPPGGRRDHDRRTAELAREPREHGGHIHAVPFVEVHPPGERGHRHAGERPEQQPAGVARDPRRRKARQIAEPERGVLSQMVAERGAEPRPENDRGLGHEIRAGADDLGRPRRQIVGRRRPAGDHHGPASSAALRRSMTGTGVGSTPRRSAT